MKKLTFLLSIFVLTLSMTVFTSDTWAASPKGQQPGAHLKITEIVVDFDAETITIVVEDLDSGPEPLEVMLGDASNVGDISTLCDEDLLSVPQTITCDFSSDGGLPADGDYLVTVTIGAGQSHSDEYDLTIRAVRTGIPGYELVISDPATCSTNQTCIARAECPPGKVVIGGGHNAALSNKDQFTSESHPTGGAAGGRQGWRADVFHGTVTNLQQRVTAYAICANP